MIDSSYPHVTEAHIAACERGLGRTIPLAYRGFLMRYNGGRPIRGVFSYTDREGKVRSNAIDQFVGVHDGRNGFAVLWQYFGERIPADTLPIATALGGNLVLIGTAGANSGKIFYWDHNWECEAGQLPDYRNVHRVAESLEAFLAGLTE